MPDRPWLQADDAWDSLESCMYHESEEKEDLLDSNCHISGAVGIMIAKTHQQDAIAFRVLGHLLASPQQAGFSAAQLLSGAG